MIKILLKLKKLFFPIFKRPGYDWFLVSISIIITLLIWLWITFGHFRTRNEGLSRTGEGEIGRTRRNRAVDSFGAEFHIRALVRAEGIPGQGADHAQLALPLRPGSSHRRLGLYVLLRRQRLFASSAFVGDPRRGHRPTRQPLQEDSLPNQGQNSPFFFFLNRNIIILIIIRTYEIITNF